MQIIAPNSLEVANRYFEAWNAHNTAALLSIFTDNGTYIDPTISGLPYTGAPIAAHARSWMDAFPNLHFEIIQIIPVGDQVAVQWRMFGTNTGRREHKPPTGATIALVGVSMISVRNQRVSSVATYFDQKSFLEQLGYNVVAYRL